jgi:hypothetical protein
MKFIERVDAIARRIERFVSGNSVADPLYLTNRTLGQKVRLLVLIGAPVVAVGALMGLALNNRFDRSINTESAAAREKAAEGKAAPVGEATAKILPNLEKNFVTEQSRDVDVVEASVSRAGDRTLSGQLRNNSEHAIDVADVVFDLTDQEGSQLGGVSVRVEHIPAKGTASFKVTVPQTDARTALVREVRSR